MAFAGAAAAQVPEVPADAVISLQRTSCFGPCPIYTVSIDASGTVTYEGERFVRVVGRRTAHIDPSTVATLLARAGQIRFFALRDTYRSIENPDGTTTTVTDLPTTIVTITVKGRTKRVEDYVGAPDALTEFEREIDNAAGTKRWVFLDEDALQELIRSGWSGSGEEGATLLQQAIERDDLPIARRLIELGSDLDGPSRNRLPPLLSARSGSMVDLLVKAGADPNERPIGRVAARTPLMETSYKDGAVAEALLKAGARLEDVDEGRTALWFAACAGNGRVVAVLIGAGANPRGSTGMSAAECTREARQSEVGRRRTVLDRGRPTVQDFDQVLALLETLKRRSSDDLATPQREAPVDEGRVSVRSSMTMSMGRRFLHGFFSRRRDWFLDFHVGFHERRGLPDEGHQLPRVLGRVLILPGGHTRPSDAVLNDVEERAVAATLNLGGSQVGHLRVHVGAHIGVALRVAAVTHRAVIQVVLTRLPPDFGLSAKWALLSIGVSRNRETDEPPCH